MNCTNCGQEVKIVPAGISKKTGKHYDSFWKCARCGMGGYVGAGSHASVIEQNKAAEKPKDETVIWEKAVVERLDKIGKLVAENNQMLKDLTLSLALSAENRAEEDEERPPLDKTEFPPKSR